MPSDLDDLDQAAAGYVNHMYQEGEPHGYAGTFLSALSRYIPRARRRIPTARQYCRNWERDVHRFRALPMPLSFLKAVVGVAIVKHRLDLAALLLAGFLGLLRTGELLMLKVDQLEFSGCLGRVLIRLPRTKTTGWRGQPEQVLLSDPFVVRALALAVKGLRSQDQVYRSPAHRLAEEIRWLCGILGFRHSRLTPYCLRRGGATLHFLTFGSLDATAVLGRWQHTSTARIYIEGATAEYVSWQLSASNEILRQRLADFAQAFFAA